MKITIKMTLMGACIISSFGANMQAHSMDHVRKLYSRIVPKHNDLQPISTIFKSHDYELICEDPIYVQKQGKLNPLLPIPPAFLQFYNREFDASPERFTHSIPFLPREISSEYKEWDKQPRIISQEKIVVLYKGRCIDEYKGKFIDERNKHLFINYIKNIFCNHENEIFDPQMLIIKHRRKNFGDMISHISLSRQIRVPYFATYKADISRLCTLSDITYTLRSFPINSHYQLSNIEYRSHVNGYVPENERELRYNGPKNENSKWYEYLKIPYDSSQKKKARECMRELGKELNFGPNLSQKIDDIINKE